jgi:hypothetical protein
VGACAKSAAQSSRPRLDPDGRHQMFNGIEAALGNALHLA